MNVAVLTATLALAAVFAVAGLAKLRDPRGSREATAAFGVPRALVGTVAIGLPAVEIAVALLLLPVVTRWWAAVSALALLVIFCLAIGRAMARGEAPECRCFGQLHSAPAGWSTLARNAVLAAAAVFVVARGHHTGASVFAWMSELDRLAWGLLALGLALAAVTAVGGYAVVHVLRSYGRVLLRLEHMEERLRSAGFELEELDEMPQLGLEPGTPAPVFWLPSLDGDRVALGDLLQPGRPLLALFTSPTCGPCTVLLPEVARWQREHVDELTVVLLSDGDPESIRAEAAEHGLEHVLLDENHGAYEAFEANGTPSAVLIADDGTIASWLAAGGDWIESLVEQAIAGLGRSPGLPVGSAAPSVPLATTGGEMLSVAEIVNGPTVVLFWNPGCGYCRAMHDDVRRWEQAPPAGAPALVVVSSGAAEDVRAEGFAATVLLDPEWALATEFGANGTPMAVLVDGDGRVARPTVTGAAAALELLGTGQLSVA